MSSYQKSKKISSDIIAKTFEDIIVVFPINTNIPASATIIVKSFSGVSKKRVLLYLRNGMRMYCFATVPLTEVANVPLQFPLEITFKILVSGMLEIYWETGSARIIYDTDEFDLNNYIRRQNLRMV